MTSNYRYDLAPYTWELVRNLKSGRAIFSQPPMPIKCAGAPQKAMYLSCDAWADRGVLGDIDVEFRNAGGVLFGVKEYVPALMEYVEKYGIDLKLNQTLVAVDGPAKTATFKTEAGEETVAFDMLHVVPPRKQAPIVAVNALAVLDDKQPVADYDGYGSCPLTVERGKIVLAEFGYGGKLLPSLPTRLIDGTRPRRLSWLLKSEALPWIYWNGMLKGHEWLARPQVKTAA